MRTQTRSMTVYLCRAAAVAALYVVLTLVSAAFGLSSGVIQFRLSEALCVLPAFTSAAVPGLGVGCLLANLLTGSPVWDVLFGTLATLLGAVGTYLLRRYKYLAPLPPVLSNTLIIPVVLRFAYGVPDGLLWLAATVGIGELVCCGGLGTALTALLLTRGNKLFK